MKTLVKILFALTFFVYCGCSPSQKILSKEIVSDEIVSDELIFEEVKEIIVEKPVIVEVPGGNVEATIDYVELRKQLEQLQNQPVIIKQDPEATARLSAYLDQLGNVVTVCEALERNQEVMVQNTETLRTQIREVTREVTEQILVEEQKSFMQDLGSWLKTSLIVALIILGASMLLPLLIKAIKPI